MGLKIQPTRRIGSKITTLIAMFALVMQPMYGLVADFVAKAAVGTVVVGQTNHATTGWNINSKGATAKFEVVSAPLGNGALKMSKGMTQGDYVQFYRESMAAPMSLNDISFQYSSKRLSGSATSAPGF